MKFKQIKINIVLSILMFSLAGPHIFAGNALQLKQDALCSAILKEDKVLIQQLMADPDLKSFEKSALTLSSNHKKSEMIKFLLGLQGINIQHIEDYVGALVNKKKLDLSPTENLLLNQGVGNLLLLQNAEVVTSFLKQAADLERSMKENGKVTFFHGRIKEWGFVNDVWNFICAAKQNKEEIPNRIILRYRDDLCDIHDLISKRKNIIEHGVDAMSSGIDCETDDNCAEITFMARTPLSNIPGSGECPLDYCLDGASCSSQSDALEVAFELLKKHGFGAYKEKIQELYLLHKQVSGHGELLCISIDETKVNDMVYTAIIEGHKRTLKNNLSMWSQDPLCDQDRERSLRKIYQDAAENKTTLEHVRYYELLTTQDSNYVEDLVEHPFAANYCLACSDIPGEEQSCIIRSINFIENHQAHEMYKKQWQQLLKERVA